MELACDIIRKKDINNNVYILVQELRKTKLGEKNNILNDDTIKRKLRPILDTTFENSEEICDSIIFAYFISSNPRYIVEKATNNYINDKLIYASNSLVAYIEYIGNEDNEEDFFKTIDYYFSLYETWKSHDLFAKMDSLHNMLEENIKIQFMSKRANSPVRTSIKNNGPKIIDTMFMVHPKIATKKLLSNYSLVSSVPQIKDKLWQNISEYSFDDQQHREHFFLILSAELRIMIIPKLHSGKDRKDIYYHVDVEDIIESIRNNRLNIDDVKKVLLLFSQKVNNLDIDVETNISDKMEKYKTWDHKFNKFMVRCFHMLYDITKNA